MLDQSLWARVIRAKYFEGSQILVPQTALPLWQSMVSTYSKLQSLYLGGWRAPAEKVFGLTIEREMF